MEATFSPCPCDPIQENPSDKYANQGTLLINVDSTVSNDDLLQIFGAYGEIKEVNVCDSVCCLGTCHYMHMI